LVKPNQIVTEDLASHPSFKISSLFHYKCMNVDILKATGIEIFVNKPRLELMTAGRVTAKDCGQSFFSEFSSG
jgi:hypothetical protein